VIKPEEKASLLQIKKQNKSPLAGAKRLNCQGASTTTYFLDESNNQERFQFFSIFTQTVSRAKIKPKKSQIKSHPTKSKEALIVRVHLPLHTRSATSKALPLDNIPDVGCVVPKGNASPIFPEGNASPIWRVMRWPKAAAHPTSAG
jgi:hypothetical protein